MDQYLTWFHNMKGALKANNLLAFHHSLQEAPRVFDGLPHVVRGSTLLGTSWVSNEGRELFRALRDNMPNAEVLKEAFLTRIEPWDPSTLAPPISSHRFTAQPALFASPPDYISPHSPHAQPDRIPSYTPYLATPPLSTTLSHALSPLPHALSPLPHALSPLPNALSPLPHALSPRPLHRAQFRLSMGAASYAQPAGLANLPTTSEISSLSSTPSGFSTPPELPVPFPTTTDLNGPTVPTPAKKCLQGELSHHLCDRCFKRSQLCYNVAKETIKACYFCKISKLQCSKSVQLPTCGDQGSGEPEDLSDVEPEEYLQLILEELRGLNARHSVLAASINVLSTRPN